MMTVEEYKNILIKYLPETAVDAVFDLIIKHKVVLSIARERKTKHGDFKPSGNGKPARISVNYNLNKYAFLITFLHELAHQITWNKYGRSAMPHGKEWKSQFTILLKPFIQNGSFPDEIAEKLDKESSAFFYSTVADTKLERELRKYNKQNGMVLLETLPESSLFMLPNGTKFKKLNKRRKNYLCLSLINKRQYVFNPLAEVIPLDQE